MITNPADYWGLLYRIQDKNNPAATAGRIPPIPIPDDETILKIDLNARTIESPEFLSTEYDHDAETLFFECDRFYDNVDLATMCCVVQYVNANNDSRIYPVPFYDTITKSDENKLLIPWQISGEVTRKSGIVQYALRFYAIDVDNQIFTYNLNTQPARSEVLHGMETKNEEIYDYEAEFKDDILYRLSRLEGAYNLYWLEVKEE